MQLPPKVISTNVKPTPRCGSKTIPQYLSLFIWPSSSSSPSVHHPVPTHYPPVSPEPSSPPVAVQHLESSSALVGDLPSSALGNLAMCQHLHIPANSSLHQDPSSSSPYLFTNTSNKRKLEDKPHSVPDVAPSPKRHQPDNEPQVTDDHVALDVQRPSATLRPASPPAHLSPTNLIFSNGDLVYQIAGLLDRSDLATCMRVSRTFHRAMKPILYKSVPYHALHSMDKNEKDLVKIASIQRKDFCSCPIVDNTYMPHPQQPKGSRALRTIIVNDMSVDLESRCEGCFHITPETRCVFPPEGTIFSVGSTGIRFNVRNYNWHMLSINYSTFKAEICNDVVMYINRLQPTQHYFCRYHSHHAVHPRPVFGSSQTLMLCILPLLWDMGPVMAKPISFRDTLTLSKFNDSLLELFCEMIFNNSRRTIRIVGLEDANPFCSGPTHWDRREVRFTNYHNALMRKLAKGLGGRRTTHWTEEEKMEFLSRLEFVTFKDFLESDEWHDELSPCLVDRWLDAYARREEQHKLPRSCRKPCFLSGQVDK